MAEIEIVSVEKGLVNYQARFRLIETIVMNKGKPDEYKKRELIGEAVAPYPPDATPEQIKEKVNEVAGEMMQNYRDVEEKKKVIDKISFRPIPAVVDTRGVFQKARDWLFHK